MRRAAPQACICYIYTTLPIPIDALVGALAQDVRCWLSVPLDVAEALVAEVTRRDAVGELAFGELPALLRSACASARSLASERVDVDEVMLRFAPLAECEEYLADGCLMLDLLLPFRDLNMPIPCTFTPPFLKKERLRLCWEHVLQIRGLLPQSSCRPHKSDTHPYDSHPMQYAVALFHFTLKMATQYREPNPYSRRLASFSLGRLARYLTRWLQGLPVELSPAVASLASQHAVHARAYRLEYSPGQRICFVEQGGQWREGVVVQPPSGAAGGAGSGGSGGGGGGGSSSGGGGGGSGSSSSAGGSGGTAERANAHLLCVFQGVECLERHVDLALHSHAVLPLYAYDAGHPLEILEPRGHWKECVVVSRAPRSNQYVVRMGPTGNQFWVLLLPWNHRSLSTHAFVPLFAVHGFAAAKWGDDSDTAKLEAIGEGAEGADKLEKPEEDNFDESATIQIEHGKLRREPTALCYEELPICP